MTTPIRVLVVDDHPMVRVGLSMVLNSLEEITFLGEASNGKEAVEFCQTNQPDVILMDIKMPQMDGIEATKQILAQYPHIRVIALTSFKEDHLVRGIMSAGALGYLLKDADRSQIEHAIIDSMAGKATLDEKAMQSLLNIAPAPNNPLSERETEVLKLMSEGMTNQEIAQKLVVSQSTVKFHVSNILVKLKVNTRTEAVAHAFNNRFFDHP
jgi:NarL family two-component system response regulator LiaR